MPRKKGYLRETLVARATDVFHRHGYRAASTEILVQALGVNRNSVYAEFGSKAGLFGAALDHYSHHVVSTLFSPLEAPGARLEHIEDLFRQFGATAGDGRGLGCLMCNTATELGDSEPGLQPRIERHLERMMGAFRNALRGAVACRDAPADTDTEAQAALLTATSLGLFVMVRAAVDTRVVRDAVNAALMQLRRLSAGAAPSRFL